MESVNGADSTPVLEAARDATRVLEAARDALADIGALRTSDCAPVRIAVALSGGRDSIALLDVFACIARDYRIDLSALPRPPRLVRQRRSVGGVLLGRMQET
jgi:predicted PP-loop superfamily ATPase